MQKHVCKAVVFRSRRALLCFDGDNINSAVNPTFRASFRGLLPSEVLQMSGNFPLLFLNFHTVADRGRTDMMLFVDFRSRVHDFIKQNGTLRVTFSDDDIGSSWPKYNQSR